MQHEKCDRCGSVGVDRRTLWHACFYAMEELSIPFREEVLFHADLETLTRSRPPVQIDLREGQKLTLQSGTVTSSGELTPHSFYTLLVCKRCRGNWLEAIKEWFTAAPQGEDNDADEPPPSSVGTGIFIRVNGVNREVTEEEYREYAREKGKADANHHH